MFVELEVPQYGKIPIVTYDECTMIHLEKRIQSTMRRQPLEIRQTSLWNSIERRNLLEFGVNFEEMNGLSVTEVQIRHNSTLTAVATKINYGYR